MAPDIDPMPTSPRQEQRTSPSTTTSVTNHSSSTFGTQTSTNDTMAMPPPTHPASASPVIAARRGSSAAFASSASEPTMPSRHPRPLTAAELYMECEKEQEAVVNRLTRELTALRARSASVASNTSHASSSASNSLLPVDITDPNPTHQLTGATHPTPSRRRGSSSVSSRSAHGGSSVPSASSSSANVYALATGAGNNNPVGSSIVPVGGQSQASAERAAAATGGSTSVSRPPSISASGTSTPARRSIDVGRHANETATNRGTLFAAPHRPSISRDPSNMSTQTSSSTYVHPGTPGPHSFHSPNLSPSQTITTQHMSETAAYRSEMEIVKAENEALRQRVRALERALQSQQQGARRDSSQSDAGGLRSDNANLTSTSGHAARSPRDREGGEPKAGRLSPTAQMHPGPAGVAAWAAGGGGVGGVAPPRERSESQSTTASSRIGIVAEDDAVRFGESAGNAGVGR
ncbi:hypothetical protein K431DRAFT_309545 [Polychaeton citri CBS 116435]|uniref:Uncharacterized protein n=1 Tax=Polychaeton citri CBS 116435 TaxID=1314669 RepID=A0A9P4QEQ0_9PEZI|nr:hypothetical protein K431DRAFT_309545 [Polychaeton citri CBS 116435]